MPFPISRSLRRRWMRLAEFGRDAPGAAGIGGGEVLFTPTCLALDGRATLHRASRVSCSHSSDCRQTNWGDQRGPTADHPCLEARVTRSVARRRDGLDHDLDGGCRGADRQRRATRRIRALPVRALDPPGATRADRPCDRIEVSRTSPRCPAYSCATESRDATSRAGGPDTREYSRHCGLEARIARSRLLLPGRERRREVVPEPLCLFPERVIASELLTRPRRVAKAPPPS